MRKKYTNFGQKENQIEMKGKLETLTMEVAMVKEGRGEKNVVVSLKNIGCRHG